MAQGPLVQHADTAACMPRPPALSCASTWKWTRATSSRRPATAPSCRSLQRTRGPWWRVRRRACTPVCVAACGRREGKTGRWVQPPRAHRRAPKSHMRPAWRRWHTVPAPARAWAVLHAAPHPPHDRRRRGSCPGPHAHGTCARLWRTGEHARPCAPLSQGVAPHDPGLPWPLQALLEGALTAPSRVTLPIAPPHTLLLADCDFMHFPHQHGWSASSVHQGARAHLPCVPCTWERCAVALPPPIAATALLPSAGTGDNNLVAITGASLSLRAQGQARKEAFREQVRAWRVAWKQRGALCSTAHRVAP